MLEGAKLIVLGDNALLFFGFLSLVIVLLLWKGSYENQKLLKEVIEWNKQMNVFMELEVGWLKAKVKVPKSPKDKNAEGG